MRQLFVKYLYGCAERESKITSHSYSSSKSKFKLSSFFKKSFTLVELSIVLVVMAILIAGVLVTRDIIDRAKIQKVMDEFEYYEKAFHQFYHIYGAVPGNVSKKTCLKHSEFSRPNHSLASVCNVFQSTADYVQEEFVSSLTHCGIYGQGYMLASAGLAREKHDEANWWNQRYTCKANEIGCGFTDQRWFISSFNKQVGMAFIGFFPFGGYPRNNANYGYKKMIQPFAGANASITTEHELDNTTFIDNVDRHNVIIMVAETPDEFKGGKQYACLIPTAGSVEGAKGVLSAKATGMLDAKFDDGQPATGKIVALKSGHARRPGATQQDITNTCYNTTFNKISDAYYTNKTDLIYGCNLIKIMEDVR